MPLASSLEYNQGCRALISTNLSVINWHCAIKQNTPFSVKQKQNTLWLREKTIYISNQSRNLLFIRSNCFKIWPLHYVWYCRVNTWAHQLMFTKWFSSMLWCVERSINCRHRRTIEKFPFGHYRLFIIPSSRLIRFENALLKVDCRSLAHRPNAQRPIIDSFMV